MESGELRLSGILANRMQYSRLVRTALLPLVLLLAPSTAPAGPDEGLELEDLRALAERRRLSIHSFRMSYTVSQGERDTPSEADIRTITRTVSIDMRGGRSRVERAIEMVSGAEPQPVEFAFDGEVESALVPHARLGLVHARSEITKKNEVQLIGLMMLNAPMPEGHGTDDGSLESFLNFSVLRPETEVIAGRDCHVLDAFGEGVHYATVWIDVERDLLPMKRVVLGRDGSEKSKITVTAVSAVENSSGGEFWLPTSWECEINSTGEVLRTSTSIDVDSVDINPPLTQQDFRIAFPPSTTVRDEVMGMTYTISPTGDSVQIVHEDLSPPGGAEIPAAEDAETALRALMAESNAKPSAQDAAALRTAPPDAAAHSAAKTEPNRVSTRKPSKLDAGETEGARTRGTSPDGSSAPRHATGHSVAAGPPLTGPFGWWIFVVAGGTGLILLLAYARGSPRGASGR